MIYIYNCYGGTHSSILAIAYHLKMLDETREPTKEEILNLPNFNSSQENINLDSIGKGEKYEYLNNYFISF